MLPSWDEGAGEIWARPKSEDVRSHCERGRPGGGRGSLLGALLWLEHQVRQDPGNSRFMFAYKTGSQRIDCPVLIHTADYYDLHTLVERGVIFAWCVF